MLTVDDKVVIGKITVTIVCEDSFGVTKHFGVNYTDSAGNFKTGWIPTVVVEAIEEQNKKHAALVVAAEDHKKLLSWVKALPGNNATIWPYPPEVFNSGTSLAAVR